MILVAPSILSADFACLYEEITLVQKAGANWLHIDVMDGHFVPNITIGPVVISKIRKHSSLLFDVHLMIEDPDRYVKEFVDAGADLITFHAETINDHTKIIEKIRSFDCKVGISINPKTKVDVIEKIIPQVDLVLIMSVQPGFAGQRFIKEVLPKIRQVREIIDTLDNEIYLEVDGGINNITAKDVISHGADVLVAGSYIFKNDNYTTAIQSLKKVKK